MARASSGGEASLSSPPLTRWAGCVPVSHDWETVQPAQLSAIVSRCKNSRIQGDAKARLVSGHSCVHS